MSGRKMALYAPGMGQDRALGPEGPLEAFAYRQLQQALEARGGAFHTLDVYEDRGDSPDVVLFLEVPPEPVATLLRAHRNAEAWVLLLESEAVHAPNWDRARHEEFTHIFTWHDEIIDGVRYHKGNFAQRLVARDAPPMSERDGFCTLIAANKLSRHPRELYSQRIASIRWYERHHPKLFDLYGRGWGDPVCYVGPPASRWGHIAARLRPLRHSHYPSWRGTVQDKLATLSRYRFAICYENAVFPGYITEKIFDCMLAGTVAVYWGPPNVEDHIPAGCFIDRRGYRDHHELHEHLASMSDEEADEIAQAARRFVASKGAWRFTGGFFVETLLALLD